MWDEMVGVFGTLSKGVEADCADEITSSTENDSPPKSSARPRAIEPEMK